MRQRFLERSLGFRLLFALAAVCCASACAAPEIATEVVVVVDGDPSVRSQLNKLVVSVYDGAGKSRLGGEEFALSKAKTPRPGQALPLSYSIVPGSDASARFRVLVVGMGRANGEDVELVRSQHIASFVPRQRQLLAVYLSDGCLGQLCADGEEQPGASTCSNGRCAPVEPTILTQAGSGSLGGYTGKSTSDAGVSSPADADAGTVDPKIPEVACETELDCQSLLEGLQPEKCAEAECVDGMCTLRARDADGDQHGTSQCRTADGEAPLGDDCDDGDASRHPGAWDGPESQEDDHPDACDGVDNDCDGMVDEGVAGTTTCECDEAVDTDVDCSVGLDGKPIVWPAGRPVGNYCRYGKQSCQNGRFTPCVGAIPPGERDSCDVPSDDTDCDGVVSEGCACTTGETRECQQPKVGICVPGKQTCNDGQWSTECAGQIKPLAADTCEPGDDSNCNGEPNEGCECVNGESKTCGEALRSKGECATKQVVCVNGKWPRESCMPSSPETCADDGKDENCDGAINEAPACECTNGRTALCGTVDSSLRGNCALGTMRCVDGRFAACDVQPAARDVCFFLDDSNCNGRITEGCACVIGESRDCQAGGCPGRQSCSLTGQWSSCVASCGGGGGGGGGGG